MLHSKRYHYLFFFTIFLSFASLLIGSTSDNDGHNFSITSETPSSTKENSISETPLETNFTFLNSNTSRRILADFSSCNSKNLEIRSGISKTRIGFIVNVVKSILKRLVNSRFLRVRMKKALKLIRSSNVHLKKQRYDRCRISLTKTIRILNQLILLFRKDRRNSYLEKGLWRSVYLVHYAMDSIIQTEKCKALLNPSLNSKVSMMAVSGNAIYRDWGTLTLVYKRNKGAFARSKHYIIEGKKISFWMKCASLASGLITSVELSTSPSFIKNKKTEAINMDFLGKSSYRLRANLFYNGTTRPRPPYVVDFGFDCSFKFHKYSISWLKNSITWSIDDRVIRQVDESYPFRPTVSKLYFHAFIRKPKNWGLGVFNPSHEPYVVRIKQILVGRPISISEIARRASALLRKRPSSRNQKLWPVIIDYCDENVLVKKSVVKIKIGNNKASCGGRFRSRGTYQYGKFSADIKCAKGNTSGLLSAFYVRSRNRNNLQTQDEIDFEFVGHNKTVVQTNYYYAGDGSNEVYHSLRFDCSKAFHTFTIIWKPSVIKWLIDYQVIRIQRKGKRRSFPKLPSVLYGSIWNASSSAGWVGPWSGRDSPYTLQFKNVQILPFGVFK